MDSPWRKQPGTIADSIVTRIVLPPGVHAKADPINSLTQGNVLGYNTILDKDFSSRIYW